MNEHDRGITGALIDEIISAVKLLENINDDSMDEILTLFIREICTNILTKTNRRVFIPELKYVVIDMVRSELDVLKSKRKADSDDDDNTNSTIQSMSEAGRSISYGASEAVKNQLALIQALAIKKLEDNEKLISKYKLLYRT